MERWRRVFTFKAFRFIQQSSSPFGKCTKTCSGLILPEPWIQAFIMWIHPPAPLRLKLFSLCLKWDWNPSSNNANDLISKNPQGKTHWFYSILLLIHTRASSWWSLCLTGIVITVSQCTYNNGGRWEIDGKQLKYCLEIWNYVRIEVIIQ